MLNSVIVDIILWYWEFFLKSKPVQSSRNIEGHNLKFDDVHHTWPSEKSFSYISLLLLFIQAREIFTRKKTLIMCCLIPVVFLMLFSFYSNSIQMDVEGGKTRCIKTDPAQLIYVWQALYVFIPVLALICFNTATIVRLRKINRIHKTMAIQHEALSKRGVSVIRPVSPELSSAVHTIENTDFSNITSETFRGETTTNQQSPSISSGGKLSVKTGVRWVFNPATSHACTSFQ